MAKKSGFMKDVPLPVKLSLVACAVVTALAGTYLLSSPSGNSMLQSGNSGKVEIAVTPSIKHGEDVETQSEIVNEVYAEHEEQKLQKAIEGKSSYIEQLKIDNEEKVAEKLVKKEEEIKQQASIDELIGIDNQIKQQREKEKVKRDQQRLISEAEPEVAYIAPVATMPLFDKDAFLLEETNRKTGYIKNRQEIVRNVVANTHGKAGTVTVSGYIPNPSDQYRSANYVGGSGDTGSTRPMADFLTDGQRLKNTVEKGKANQVAQLEKYRDTANGKSGSSQVSPTQSGASNDSVINELANPMGFTDQSSMTYVTPGTIYYSILEIGVNTDEISHVRALVVQEGPLKGGVLLGLPERRGEKAIIAFNKLSLGGREYAIDAVALDLDTMRSGMADSVDRHTFERYSKLMAAAFISGYAESLSGGTTKTYSDGTTETIVERLPDTEDQIAYAIGQAGEKLVPIFEREFDRVPTVEVDANREMAIMLLSGLEIIE